MWERKNDDRRFCVQGRPALEWLAEECGGLLTKARVVNRRWRRWRYEIWKQKRWSIPTRVLHTEMQHLYNRMLSITSSCLSFYILHLVKKDKQDEVMDNIYVFLEKIKH